MVAVARLAAVYVAITVVLVSCEEAGQGPVIQLSSDRTVVAGQTLRIKASVPREAGHAEFDVRGDLPQGYKLSRVDDYSALFEWTPLITDVGIYEIEIVASTSAGESSAKLRLEVVPPNQDIRVLTPLEATYDLSEDPGQLILPIQVRADTVTQVTFVTITSFVGADIFETGPKQAELRWYPQPDQKRAGSVYVFSFKVLTADQESPEFHATITVAGCPTSEQPRISFDHVEREENTPGYAIYVKITDKESIIVEAKLHWRIPTTERTGSQMMVPMGNDLFRGVIPDDVLTGETEIEILVIATDGDDLQSTTCDKQSALGWQKLDLSSTQ